MRHSQRGMTGLRLLIIVELLLLPIAEDTPTQVHTVTYLVGVTHGQQVAVYCV